MMCSSSKLFKEACSATWEEGEEGIVRLPTVKTPIFEVYFDIIYISGITNYMVGPLTASIDAVIDLYLLGDIVDDMNLRNKTMEALQWSIHTTVKELSSRGICYI